MRKTIKTKAGSKRPQRNQGKSDMAVSMEGYKAAAHGVNWWVNPYPSGSAYAYIWDKGHTHFRTQ